MLKEKIRTRVLNKYAMVTVSYSVYYIMMNYWIGNIIHNISALRVIGAIGIIGVMGMITSLVMDIYSVIDNINRRCKKLSNISIEKYLKSEGIRWIKIGNRYLYFIYGVPSLV